MLSSYRLTRIPQDNSLKAWNAADELLLNRLEKQTVGKLLLVNDNFGALAVALSGYQPDWWNDSAMAEQAMRLNCENNSVAVPAVLESDDELASYDTIVIHIPKSVSMFRWQLRSVIKNCHSDTQLYALGMVKHIGKGHIDAMNELFADCLPGRAEKKARVIALAGYKGSPAEPNRAYAVEELGMSFTNLPGCFAEAKPDPGGRMFIQMFDQLPQASSVLDLGCGNGLLSAAFLVHQPNASLTLVDESQQAIASAKLNLRQNHPEAVAHFLHSNGLDKIADGTKFDLILCNPPFHQENTVTEQIALRLFADAARHLSSSGQLWIVANRSLNYFRPLKTLFKSVETDSRHRKFTVYQCSQIT